LSKLEEVLRSPETHPDVEFHLRSSEPYQPQAFVPPPGGFVLGVIKEKSEASEAAMSASATESRPITAETTVSEGLSQDGQGSRPFSSESHLSQQAPMEIPVPSLILEIRARNAAFHSGMGPDSSHHGFSDRSGHDSDGYGSEHSDDSTSSRKQKQPRYISYNNPCMLKRDAQIHPAEFEKQWSDWILHTFCSFVRAGNLGGAKSFYSVYGAFMNINRALDVDDYTSLQYAVHGGHMECAMWLIEDLNADTSIVTRDRWNLLHIACSRGNLEMAKYLMMADNTLSIGSHGKFGVTPISLMIDHSQIGMLRDLLGDNSEQTKKMSAKHGVRKKDSDVKPVGMYSTLPPFRFRPPEIVSLGEEEEEEDS
jgi:Ankyrin repeats (many copies)